MENFGYVLATKMLVNGKRKVRYMYHEKPDNSQDSGWRFFCGDEDDDYVNNPDNIVICDIRTVLSADTSILPYLADSAYGAWEREDENTGFRVSDNFVPDEEM